MYLGVYFLEKSLPLPPHYQTKNFHKNFYDLWLKSKESEIVMYTVRYLH